MPNGESGEQRRNPESIHEQRPLAVYQFEALGRQADGSGYHVSTP